MFSGHSTIKQTKKSLCNIRKRNALTVNLVATLAWMNRAFRLLTYTQWLQRLWNSKKQFAALYTHTHTRPDLTVVRERSERIERERGEREKNNNWIKKNTEWQCAWMHAHIRAYCKLCCLWEEFKFAVDSNCNEREREREMTIMDK